MPIRSVDYMAIGILYACDVLQTYAIFPLDAIVGMRIPSEHGPRVIGIYRATCPPARLLVMLAGIRIHGVDALHPIHVYVEGQLLP